MAAAWWWETGWGLSKLQYFMGPPSSQLGLKIAAVLAILASQHMINHSFSSFQWGFLYVGLRPFLRPSGSSAEGRLDFYHRSISKVIRQLYLSDEKVRAAYHLHLIKFFSTWWVTDKFFYQIRCLILCLHEINVFPSRQKLRHPTKGRRASLPLHADWGPGGAAEMLVDQRDVRVSVHGEKQANPHEILAGGWRLPSRCFQIPGFPAGPSERGSPLWLPLYFMATLVVSIFLADLMYFYLRHFVYTVYRWAKAQNLFILTHFATYFKCKTVCVLLL